MKLTVPALLIKDGEGFTREKDIFNRKPFAEELTKLVTNTDDELVIALDAKWGEGKTTFVKMWQGLLEESGIHSI
jgi:tRNA A37 threonylcarbamoyladenosine biosynthesis protein TsaE